MKLVLAMLIFITAICNASDAVRKRSDCLQIGVMIYWCLVSGYWIVNVLEMTKL